LLDMGFGYSQVLPIITQLWTINQGRSMNRTAYRWASAPAIFAMEQPELHLHPAFQTRLMDAFVASIGQSRQTAEFPHARTKLIVETHSETLINHLGKRVFEGKIRPDDISVL